MFRKLWAKAKALYLRRTSSSYYEETFKDTNGNEFKRVVRNGVVIEDNFKDMTPEQRADHGGFMGSFEAMFTKAKSDK